MEKNKALEIGAVAALFALILGLIIYFTQKKD